MKEDLAKAIFGQRADMYVDSTSHNDPQNLNFLVELAEPEKTWKALDIATGTGHMTLSLAPFVSEIRAIDLTEEMLKFAKDSAKERGISNVTFELGDAHRLMYAAESFDLVTCRRAAHHFSDIERAVGEMARVLKAGSTLLIDDRSIPEDDFTDALMNELDTLHDESHVREYRSSEWLTLLKGAGFAIVNITTRAQKRPVTSLTERVEEIKAKKIIDILTNLTPGNKALLGVETIDGTIYSYHWFVTIKAIKV